MLTVINDILDFSKVEAGKLDLDPQNMDLRGTVEDVARILALQAHAKGLEVTVQIDPRVPERPTGDPGRIRQILLNLSSNAVKFTARGEISLDVQLIESTTDSHLVRCEVRDTGIGIAPERIGSLFAPFVQADPPPPAAMVVRGLGLSIARRLAELMGGETGAESTPGVGSTFWFTARLKAAGGGTSSVMFPLSSVIGRRVLVVDDNFTNRRILHGQLEQCGAKPESVANAADAMATLRQARAEGRQFDVALLIIRCRIATALELGKMIVRDPGLRSTPLVLLTSSGQRGAHDHFAQIGFAGYSLKPVAMRDLVKCLAAVLGHDAEQWRQEKRPLVTHQALAPVVSRRVIGCCSLEDNLVNQKVALRMLEKLGYHADVAPDGRAAARCVENRQVRSRVRWTCEMPGMDGYDARPGDPEARRPTGSTRLSWHSRHTP